MYSSVVLYEFRSRRVHYFHSIALFICVQEFIGDEKGHVKGIRTVEINWVQVRILFPWYNSVGI